MKLREFLGTLRYKLLQFIFGKNLYVNKDEINKIEYQLTNINNTLKKLENKEKEIINIIKKVIPKSYIDFIEIHLTEHCNLDCWGCCHFSTLAKEEYLSIEVFEKDMHRLFELTKGDIGRINLMGGEPLLHPEIIKFFEVCRNYFKHTIIRLVTNGILLNSMNEEFWNSVKYNDIHITPTKYPINVQWNEIEQLANHYGVKYYYFSNSAEKIKTMSCIALDIEGMQNQFNNFYYCHEGNNCFHIRKGRIFTCPIAAYAEHFNEYFNQNLDISDANSIDIYKVENINEILSFLSHPIPFCRYCDIMRRSSNAWKTSKKEINEWTGK